MMRSIIKEAFAVNNAHSTRVRPAIFCRFLCGIPFDPPLAGTKAIILFLRRIDFANYPVILTQAYTYMHKGLGISGSNY